MKYRQAGFTIIELMIATAIFSVVLLIVTTGVISFSRSYYHGIVNNNTQNITRGALNEITQNIQFSAGNVSTKMSAGGETSFYCVNGRPYYFILGRQLDGNDAGTSAKHVLVTTDDTCPTPLLTPDIAGVDFSSWPGVHTNPRELLGKGLRLIDFSITPNATATLFTVTIKAAYGDTDLLCSPTPGGCIANPTITELAKPNVRCRSDAGSQFCTIAGLTANVANRLYSK